MGVLPPPILLTYFHKTLIHILHIFQTFSANFDYYGIVTIFFPHPVKAQFLRINPTECYNNCGLRFEVLGCSLVDDCSDDPTNKCHTNAKCYDNIDGYQCICDPGFIGDGFDCQGKHYFKIMLA